MGRCHFWGEGGRAVREPPLREGTGGRVPTRLFGPRLGPRMREDNGRGTPILTFPHQGGREGNREGDGSPHARGQREGELRATRFLGYARNDRWDWGLPDNGGSRTAPTRVGRTAYNGRPQGSPLQEKDGGVGCSPPSPVLTRAGSNLPPSRGKGFVGVERAIFLVMTCGWPRCLRVARGHGKGGWVPACARTTGGGEVCTPILTFPHQGGREGNREGDGSPHARGQREGEGANEGREVTEPSLRIGS